MALSLVETEPPLIASIVVFIVDHEIFYHDFRD